MKNSALLTLVASSMLLLTAISAEANDNPCATVDCHDGEKCVLQKVVCIRAPCNPIPTCVPINSTKHDGGDYRSKREVPGGNQVTGNPNDNPCNRVRCPQRCRVVKNCREGPCRLQAECVSS